MNNGALDRQRDYTEKEIAMVRSLQDSISLLMIMLQMEDNPNMVIAKNCYDKADELLARIRKRDEFLDIFSNDLKRLDMRNEEILAEIHRILTR